MSNFLQGLGEPILQDGMAGFSVVQPLALGWGSCCRSFRRLGILVGVRGCGRDLGPAGGPHCRGASVRLLLESFGDPTFGKDRISSAGYAEVFSQSL